MFAAGYRYARDGRLDLSGTPEAFAEGYFAYHQTHFYLDDSETGLDPTPTLGPRASVDGGPLVFLVPNRATKLGPNLCAYFVPQAHHITIVHHAEATYFDRARTYARPRSYCITIGFNRVYLWLFELFQGGFVHNARLLHQDLRRD